MSNETSFKLNFEGKKAFKRLADDLIVILRDKDKMIFEGLFYAASVAKTISSPALLLNYVLKVYSMFLILFDKAYIRKCDNSLRFWYQLHLFLYDQVNSDAHKKIMAYKTRSMYGQHVNGRILNRYTSSKNSLLTGFVDAFRTNKPLLLPQYFFLSKDVDINQCSYLYDQRHYQMKRIENFHVFDLITENNEEEKTHEINIRLAKWQREIVRQRESVSVILATLCCTETGNDLDLKEHILGGQILDIFKQCFDKVDHDIKTVAIKNCKRIRDGNFDKKPLKKRVKFVNYII